MVILTFLFVKGELCAQDCGIGDKIDWKLVEIKIMEQKDPPAKYEVNGEQILKSKKSIEKLSDLSRADKRKIQKKAARNGTCLVFIDTKRLWGAVDGLYYYWVKLE